MNLADYCDAHGKQTEAANALGCSVQLINDLLHGRRRWTVDRLLIASRKLGLDPIAELERSASARGFARQQRERWSYDDAAAYIRSLGYDFKDSQPGDGFEYVHTDRAAFPARVALMHPDLCDTVGDSFNPRGLGNAVIDYRDRHWVVQFEDLPRVLPIFNAMVRT